MLQWLIIFALSHPLSVDEPDKGLFELFSTFGTKSLCNGNSDFRNTERTEKKTPDRDVDISDFDSDDDVADPDYDVSYEESPENDEICQDNKRNQKKGRKRKQNTKN
ncbi:hypothetical protein FQA39_LY11711 [Lamprigera yunnana]|nr:hypothetical protein FQA39_LY11711 [Lamprigera yunnana]